MYFEIVHNLLICCSPFSVWIQKKEGTDRNLKGFFLQTRLAANYTTGYHPLDGTFERVDGYQFTGPYNCPTSQDEDAQNVRVYQTKDLFTPSKSGSESEKDQTTTKVYQRISDKHQRKFSLSLSILLAVNRP